MDFDVIVVGSGQNGLTAAAYLATGGKRVLVLERNDHFGGGVSTREIAPGYLSERHALIHELILANPLISEDELHLQSRYGLDYIPLDPPHAALFDDGTNLSLFRDRERTKEEIAKFSAHDAEAWDEFMDQGVGLAEALIGSFFEPPLPAAAAAQALGSLPDGDRLTVEFGKSVVEVYEDWFESDQLKIALERRATEIMMTSPDDRGSGVFAYMSPALLERWGNAVPRGGGKTFNKALVDCIEDHGGETRHSTPVVKVISRGGRAVGVRTEAGEEIGASDAVLAAIHPYHLDQFVDGLDPRLQRDARSRKTSTFSVFGLHGVLPSPMRAKAGPELDRSIWNTMSSPSFRTMLESLDELRRGRLPRVPVLSGGSPSNADPTRAAGDGGALLHLYCLSTYDLADGGPGRWEKIKKEVARELLERVGDFYDGVDADAVEALEIVTPLDHERDSSSMVAGDLGGLAMFSNQVGGLRPTPELSQYAVPGVGGLYLTGPFMHPGQGVNGGGRAVAIRMFEDLGLDFSEIGGAVPTGGRVRG